MKKLSFFVLICALGGSPVDAQNLKISLGIRETGGTGPIFSNAGTAGGIEWVNRDGQTLAADGTWQLFTFTPSTDALLAFAGATANSILDTDWVSLEHIRILNSDGITAPIRLWIDDVSNTDSAGTVTEGFESSALGTEVMFQEPKFSGSTSANLATTPNSSLVSDSMAFSGNQSTEVNFQFIDNTPTRWVRLTTFTPLTIPNPALHVRESGFTPTVSFYAKAVVIPEPAGLSLLGLGTLAVFGLRRKR